MVQLFGPAGAWYSSVAIQLKAIAQLFYPYVVLFAARFFENIKFELVWSLKLENLHCWRQALNSECDSYFWACRGKNTGVTMGLIENSYAAGRGGTPLYKLELYKYVSRQGEWFLNQCGLKMGIEF